MRNLKECKEEIILRSERRIKERKKSRTRITLVCFSFCLALVFLGAIFPQFILNRTEKASPDGWSGSSDLNDKDGFAEINKNDGTFFPDETVNKEAYISVSVRKDGKITFLSDFSDSNKVKTVRDEFIELFENYCIKDAANDRLEFENEYIVTIHFSGETYKCSLYDRYLFDESNQIVKLTDKQLNRLYTMLGLNLD